VEESKHVLNYVSEEGDTIGVPFVGQVYPARSDIVLLLEVFSSRLSDSIIISIRSGDRVSPQRAHLFAGMGYLQAHVKPRVKSVCGDILPRSEEGVMISVIIQAVLIRLP